METIDQGHALSKVPNLIYRERGRVRATPVVPAGDCAVADSRGPDFDGLPLDRYLTPELILPLLSSYGCYHGKCAFCNVGYGGPDRFRMMDPDLVVDQMRALRQRYGSRHFFFSDEALTPRTLRVLSTRLAEGGDDLAWCGCARLDPGLTRELLETMASGGCRMLLFGLETAAESTIARMHKGTERQTMSRILRDSATAEMTEPCFLLLWFSRRNDGKRRRKRWISSMRIRMPFIRHRPEPFSWEHFTHRRTATRPAMASHASRRPCARSGHYFDYRRSFGTGRGHGGPLASKLVDVLPNKAFGQYYVA